VNARELGQDPWTALVVRPTYPDERIQIENEAPVRAMAGVQGLVRLERNHGVAVVADSFWHAYQARREYEKELGHRAGPPPGVDRTSSDVLMKSYRDAVESRPDPSAVENTYCTPYGAHAPLEPMSAACVRDARNTYHIYTATQFPPAARGAAAAVLGIPEHRVRIHGLLAGGSFGRRYASDFVVEVAQICQAMGGRAVKLIWTREDDFRHDFLRPCAVSHVSARMTSSTIARWTHRLASESATFAQIGEVASAIPGVARLAHEYGGTFALPKSLDSADGTLKEGISDSVYSLPQRFGSIKIVSVPERGGVRIGYWRSVGYFHTIFAVESMMDELARKADANPVDFRRQAFDQKYAARATWCLNAIGRDGRSAKLKEYGTGYGMACFRAWGSFAALAVRVSVDTPEEEIRVREVWAAVDCGFVVCPDIVKQQIEGGIIFGLSAALKQEITTEHGIVKETNFHQCDLLRMHECPSIEVVYNQGHGPDVAPGGVGELIVPLVAPAVANAVYNLRRRRLTALPLRLKART
jgi:isoquinoline 1-oxidoreductase beta subunit